MGLDISVGYLAQLDSEENLEESEESVFGKVNRVLISEGLASHTEPSDVPNAVGYEMYGYSGLHRCRRAAAHQWKFGRVENPVRFRLLLLRRCSVRQPTRLGHVPCSSYRIHTPVPVKPTIARC